MKLSKYFSSSELKAIEAAVQRSEKGTSGEIVPVFVEQCSPYLTSLYKGALGMALVTFIVLIILTRLLPDVGLLFDPLVLMLLVILGAGVGSLITRYLPGLRRLLEGKKELERSAFSRAEHFFLREEVFMTRQRTGIMIFIALFEHQVIVRADKGITQVVAQQEWDEIVNQMVQEIKSGQMAEGLIHAIDKCAELLREKGIHAHPDDVNELSNELRTDD